MLMFKEKEICNCPCHEEGYSIMHCAPCCDFTYQTYINEDGTLNEEKFQKLVDGDEK